MSWYVSLAYGYEAAWLDYPYEISPETMAAKCYWKLPLKVYFDDAAILLRFLERLNEQYAEPPEEIWAICDLRDNSRIEHPTWDELRKWLERAVITHG